MFVMGIADDIDAREMGSKPSLADRQCEAARLHASIEADEELLKVARAWAHAHYNVGLLWMHQGNKATATSGISKEEAINGFIDNIHYLMADARDSFAFDDAKEVAGDEY